MKVVHALSASLWAGSIPARLVAFPLTLLSLALVFAQPCAGGSGSFSNTGSLNAARAFFTATLLPNGKVLVAGGASDGTGGSIASAELYDPATGTWTATGTMSTARTWHTATLLPNGKVLVAGGFVDPGGILLASAELYDPATGTWTTTGSMGAGRYDYTATLLPNGKVLVAAGRSNDIVASTELYDPASGTWTATGSLAHVREGHTATLLPNGKVLVAGGFNGTDVASAELYDPASGTWTATGTMSTGRVEPTATLLPSGKVLVAGGRDTASTELYDPGTGTWTATGTMSIARVQHTATLLPDGKVLAAGNNAVGHQAGAELYDPASGVWSATGSLVTGRASHTATLLPNGKVLVAGGFNSDITGNLASAELYTIGQSPPATLLNISTRMRVQTGENVLIGGFIVAGTDPKRVIVRGIGPSLSLSGALADPTLELYQGNTLLATNDNWRTDQQAEILATGIAPTNDLESAIVRTLTPGSYTVILRGNNDSTGIGEVETYDLDQTANSTLANISTRGFVDTGDNVMIGGFIVGGGTGTARVIVRALGPSVPVAGPLDDPTLELHDASGTTVASNDNWKTRSDGSSQQAEIEATTVPPTNDLESALVQTLAPGAYTAVVRGKNNATGVGLVEAYNLPQ